MTSVKQDIKLSDVLRKEVIVVDLKSKDKAGVIEELSSRIELVANVSKDEVIRVLMERELVGSTGIGGGIGIPHGKLKDLETPILGIGLSRKGVDFDAMDRKPVHIFVLVITPETATGYHLQLLARISRLLKNDSFKKRLLLSATSDEIVNHIKEQEEFF